MQPAKSLRLCSIALVLAGLAFLATDSVMRIRTIRDVTGFHFPSTNDPQTMLDSPSAYEGNQHRIVVPYLDAYHWFMQTQLMLANGDTRVRWVDYDGPPGGRAVHWSSSLHWFAAIPAWIDSKISHDPAVRSAEGVFPWVATVCLALLMLVLLAVGIPRFGWLATSLLVVGFIAVFPAYESFVVGNFDHHGLAAACALLTTLCLIGGGAGWLRRYAESAKGARPIERVMRAWLPEATHARRWFIASGIAGGAGLWISAATQVPALIGIGIGAAVAMRFLHPDHEHDDGARIDAGLWRTWGMAGAVTSLVFYGLEYAPSHIGMRLEVNHPLYALAWFGAGDFLARWGTRDDRTPRRLRLMALDVTMILVLPAIVLLVPSTFVIRPGSLVLAIHQDYITEFQGMRAQFAASNWTQLVGVLGLVGVMVSGVAVAAARTIPRPLRAMAFVAVSPATLFTLMSIGQVRWFGDAASLWLVVLVVVVLAATWGREPWRAGIAILLFAGAAAVLVLLPFGSVLFRSLELSIADIPRWPVLLALAGLGVYVSRGVIGEWTRPRLVCAGFALGAMCIPSPAIAVRQWIRGDGSYPTTVTDLWQLATRDAAERLRARLGAERGMIVGAPTASTLMTYFGGMRSLGTLYWENAAGLELSAALLGAMPAGSVSAADSARKIVVANGVTHLVFFSWNPFVVEYARLAQGLRPPHDPGADTEMIRPAFAEQLVAEQHIPRWLRPLAYALPSFPALAHDWVRVYEVVPDQTDDELDVHTAQYDVAMGDTAAALMELHATLTRNATQLPALVELARVQQGGAKGAAFDSTLRRIRAHAGVAQLGVEDRINLAVVFSLASDTASARAVFAPALAAMNERDARRLFLDNFALDFIGLGRLLRLSQTRPELYKQVTSLLPADIRARVQQSQ